MRYNQLALVLILPNTRPTFQLNYFDPTFRISLMVYNYYSSLPRSNALNLPINPVTIPLMQQYDDFIDKQISRANKSYVRWPGQYKRPDIVPDNNNGYRLRFNNAHINIPYPLLYENTNTFDIPNAVAIGPIIESDPVIVDYRSPNNQLRGVIKRVAHAYTFTPDPNNLKKMHPNFYNSFKAFVKRQVSKFDPLPHYEMSHELLDEQWLNDAKHYNLHQKKNFHELLDAFMSTTNRSISHLRNYKNGDIYACKSFIKREFYDETKEPRIINSRSDLFKALVAPYIKMIEHVVIYNEHYIKGKHPEQRVQRMSEIMDRYKFVAESDYSSFEGSFSQELMSICEWELFKHMLHDNQEILNILLPIYADNFKNTIIFSTDKNHHTYATFDGSRMSGDMWTSLGNGFTNQMLFEYCAYKSHKLPSDSYDFIVEGDDGFFGYNYDIDFTPVAQLGFRLKIEKGTHFNDLSFCGTLLGPGGTAVPDFWRTIEKFGWSFEEHIVRKYSDKINKAQDELLYAKALSLAAESEGVPILQPLAHHILSMNRTGRLVQRYITYYEEEILQLSTYQPKCLDITNQMREFFAQTFKIPVSRQLEIESFISKQKSPRFILPINRKLDNITHSYSL